MDMIESLAKQASQISMYDIKSYYNQAKNVVLNIPEMEAKVREATNEEPWGASSTLMQEIAQGTHNYQHFNEIMPTIYSRFMEKEAREWRQIYKALTLLEYLIKHGSERVVDDARAHVSTVKMLRNFHYIDDTGKDQGINVRNRASEIATLLGDVDKIRGERRKAKANRAKYQGHEGGMFNAASGSRYGGFGSDSYRGGGGGGGSSSGFGGSSSYRGGDDDYRGGGGGGGRSSSFRDTQGRKSYDEYEGADDFDAAPPRSSSRGSRTAAPAAPPKPPKEQPKAKQPEVNLFDFDDEDSSAAATTSAAPAAAAPIDAFGDDDFDDFQEAPGAAPISSAPAPAPAAATGGNANLFALLETSTPSAPAPARAPAPSFSPAAAPTSPPSYMASMAPRPAATSPVSRAPAPSSPPATSAPKKPASTFDDLFSASLGAPLKPSGPTGGKTIAQMEKEKTMSSLWGPSPTAASSAQPLVPQQGRPAQPAAKPAASTNFDDLLL